MLWIALHLPLLSLEAFSATLNHEQRAAPLALVADHRIGAVNVAAAERGLRPGLKRATALALAGDLLLGQADAARDAQALQAVAHAALAFTPMVVLASGHSVLLEVQSSLRYFGGPAPLRQRLQAALQPLGHRVQLASAPTALGAALLARWRDDLAWGEHSSSLPAMQELLDRAPVWLLGPGREHWEVLQGMGLHTLADLRSLPRAGLVRRFGATLLAELDAARGDRPDLRKPIVAPAVFDSRLELFARADSTSQVLHGANLLLARLLAWAQARQSRVTAFTLRMDHDSRHGDRTHTELTVELAEPVADASHLQALLREHLARCTLPAPTLELHLHCHQIVIRAAPNGELFPSRQGEREGLTRLLERLRARLGDSQVQRLQPLADHRPEHASRLVAGGLPGSAASVPAEASTLPLHRPAWLLASPLALAERQALPLLDGRPLQLVSGPERIEAGWWDGSELASRDYFIAQAGDGALVWIYRTRLATPDGWFLQGRFG
jgi:protein ImuB